AAESTRRGGDVGEPDPYAAAPPSLEPYLSRLRRGAGIDVLLVAGEPPGAELVLREMAALGVRWPVLGGDALTGIEAAGGGTLAGGGDIRAAYLPDRREARNAAVVADYALAFAGRRPGHSGPGTDC